MDKNGKKKAAESGRKGAKPMSDYKSSQANGKTSQADAVFQKAFGKSKATPQKG